MGKMDCDDMPGGYKDGWSSWNPNGATCEECGSADVEFLWSNGKVRAMHCLKCDGEEGGK